MLATLLVTLQRLKNNLKARTISVRAFLYSYNTWQNAVISNINNGVAITFVTRTRARAGVYDVYAVNVFYVGHVCVTIKRYIALLLLGGLHSYA